MTITDKEIYKKRARAKYFTNSYIYKLLALESPLEKSYLSTLSCASILQPNENKLISKYCNQRWCTVCNRIRVAKMVNGYSQQIKSFDNPYFVTLTVPNCELQNLSSTLSQMDKNFKKITDVLRKQNIKLKAIRKTEVTYNHSTGLVHPHYHVILESFDGFFQPIINYAIQINII